MKRRTILALPAAFALPALIAACGGDDKGSGTTAKSSAPAGQPDQYGGFIPSVDPAQAIPKDRIGKVNAVVAGQDFYVGGTNNFVFGITDSKDEPQGGADATATFYDLKDPKKPKPVYTIKATASAPGVGPQVVHTHGNGQQHTHGGEDEGRVGYYVPVSFDHAGFWGLLVQAKLKDGTEGASSVGFEVFPKSQIPAPGQPAPKSDNLTKKDVAKISEIDSGDPPNDMHDVKIKDAIAGGRPLVIVFSTPAFCQSRFCGPVNEEVEDLQKDYRDRVDFVHIEIWRDFDKKVINPTAREWLLRPDGGISEPFVYVVGKDGVIYNRWEGPVARNIMEPSVKAVAAGEAWKKA